MSFLSSVLHWVTFREVVYVKLCRILGGLVLLCVSCDASLEGAYDCETTNIIGTGISSGFEQGGGIFLSLSRQAL